MSEVVIKLNFSDHSRKFKDCVYVYPVVSRRAQGVSLGINLNPNNACNWRCIYCQVEELKRGMPPRINLAKLEAELEMMLVWLIDGDFINQFAPEGLRRFNDICLSGNGESTLSVDFLAVCQIIAKLRAKHQINSTVKTILITNGSQLMQAQVQQAIRLIAANSGELWFKIDRATTKGIAKVNQVELSINGVIKRLQIAVTICPTYIQSCWFNLNAIEPSQIERDEFVNLMCKIKDLIQGVLLYSTARQPALSEGQAISQVSESFMQSFAKQLISNGISLKWYL